MREEIRNIRSQNDLMAAIAIAIEERQAEDLEDMNILIQDWMIDEESSQVLQALIEAAISAVLDLQDFHGDVS
jgi:hypothetical protein